MEFDFTNTSDQGYTVLPPDRYDVKSTEWWLRKKEETGNIVIDMDMEVISGDYQGESVRNFHAITQQESTKGFLLRMLKALGIVEDGDRGKNGELKVEFVYGDEDDNGRVEVTAVEVNGEEREVEGREAVAVVTKRPDQATGETRTGVARLEQAGSGSNDGEEDKKEKKEEKPKGGKKASGGGSKKGSKGKGNVPF